MSGSATPKLRPAKRQRRPQDDLPPELRGYVPEPKITLGGCRPLVPYHGVQPYPDGPFHALPLPPERVADRDWPADACPCCKGLIGRRDAGPVNATIDEDTGCLWCHGASPENERRAAEMRSLAETRRTLATVRRAAVASGAAAAQGRLLTESERRAIWNGRRGGIRCPLDLDGLESALRVMHRKAPKFLDRVRAGREFLEAIGQLPDWDLVRHNGRWTRRSAVPVNDLADLLAAEGRPSLRSEAT